jgi:hypothetical protein
LHLAPEFFCAAPGRAGTARLVADASSNNAKTAQQIISKMSEMPGEGKSPSPAFDRQLNAVSGSIEPKCRRIEFPKVPGVGPGRGAVE